MDKNDVAVIGVIALMASVPVIFAAWVIGQIRSKRRMKREASRDWHVPTELLRPAPRPVRFRLNTLFGGAVIPIGVTAIAWWALLTGQPNVWPWLGLLALGGPFLCFAVVHWTHRLTADEKRLLECGAIAQGTIIGRRYLHYSAKLGFEYSPPGAAKQFGQHESRTGEWTHSLRPGDSVTVLYDPHDSEKCTLYPCNRWKIGS